MNFDFNDILSSLYHIRGGVPVKRLSRRVRLGWHRSVFFGPSNDFFDIHEYDEERDPPNQIIDALYDPDEDIIWARKTIEEHEVRIRFFIDLSSSIDSGTDFAKRRMLLEALGFIGVTGARYQDQVGLIGFTDKIVLNVPPRGGIINFVHLLRTLYDYLERRGADSGKMERRKTDFFAMLEFIRKTLDRPCFVPIISDFVNFDKVFDSPAALRLLKFLAVRHEMIFIFLDDPAEVANVRGAGSLRVEDIETGEQAIIARRKADEIQQDLRLERTILRKRKLAKIGIDSVVLEPGKQIKRLQKFFMKRLKSLRV